MLMKTLEGTVKAPTVHSKPQ
jgi:hypothetical protein